jgi:DNA-binding transcriptional MerR regulator
MLKIGEFSRLCQVTVKTLRYYDDIGLLKPAQIDKFTDYRYYTLDQLPRIHSIMALKELGLSLEEIAGMMSNDLPPEQIRGMFRLRQAEAQQRVREEQARLAQIEFRLRQIEGEGMMQTVDIVVKRVEPFYALTLHDVYHTEQEFNIMGAAIAAAVQQGQIKPGGAHVSIFYQEEWDKERVDFEYCVPVESGHTKTVSLGAVGTLALRELPAIEQAATYIHQGDFEEVNEKILLLQRWAVENGYKLSTAWRIIHHRGPMHHVPASEYLFELQHPIERA